MLARQSLARNTIGEGLGTIRPRLTQMPHEQGHVSPDKEKHLMVHARKVIKWHQQMEKKPSECKSHCSRGLEITKGLYFFYHFKFFRHKVCVGQTVEKVYQVKLQVASPSLQLHLISWKHPLRKLDSRLRTDIKSRLDLWRTFIVE